LSFKLGKDTFIGSTAMNEILQLKVLTQEELDAARKYMIKHNAEDLLEVVGL